MLEKGIRPGSEKFEERIDIFFFVMLYLDALPPLAGAVVPADGLPIRAIIPIHHTRFLTQPCVPWPRCRLGVTKAEG